MATQSKIGWRPYVNPYVSPSTLWNSIYSVWNADTLGTSLDTSIFRAYNGENATMTPTQLSTNIFGVWNADGTNNLSVKHAWNANGDAVDSKSGANGTIATPSGTSWTPSTMTYGSGKLGSGAFTFNGSNFVSLPADTLKFTGDFSVSAWIYVPTAFGTNISRIISCFDNQTGPTTYRGWEVVYNNGTVKLQIYPSGANYYIISVPMTLKDQWVHVTAVRLAGQQGEIYINGVAGTKTVSANGATSASSIAYGTGNLAYIGALYDSGLSPRYSVTPAGGFKIDALQTFNNAALDQVAVTELYNSGNGQEYPFTLSSSLIATYNDSVGSNHGTTPASTLTGGVPGPSFTTGKIGKAFTFDGINDFVELGDIMDLGLSSWSYSMWFNVSNTNNSMLFSKTIQASSFGRIWAGTNASKVYFAFQIDLPGSNPSSNIVIETTSNISTNTWYHVTFVFDRSDKMKIYLNGSLSSVNTTSGTNNLTPYSSWDINTNHPFRIGAFTTSDNIGTTANFTGKIDAFSVWNRAITNDEITALYNSGNGQQYPFSSVTLSNSMLDSVNAQNGTNINNVTLTTGKVGNAFTFTSAVAGGLSNQYISLPSDGSLNFTGDFSVSAWVYIPSSTSGGDYFYIVSNMGCDSWFTNPVGWRFMLSGNNVVFSIFNHTNTYYSLQAGYQFIPVTGVSPGVWAHLAFSRKGSTGSKIYINGNLVASDANTVNPDYSTAAGTIFPTIGNLYMGVGGSKQNYYYPRGGTKIDAITIWNKTLTDDEVFNLYNDGSGAEYPFTNQSLASLNDSIGSNHGTRPASTLTGGVAGPSFTTGKIGKAFNFDGINDIVRLSNNSLDLTGDFSISMWANWGRNNTSQILMSNFTIGASTRGWFIEHAAGQLRFRGFNSTGGNAFYIYIAYTPPLNTWIHYTFVHKNNSNKMYADGVLIGSDTGGSTHVAYDTPNYPMIGANQYNATTYQEFFLGKLDAVSVWNRELTATEITELYNSGNGKQYPN